MDSFRAGFPHTCSSRVPTIIQFSCQSSIPSGCRAKIAGKRSELNSIVASTGNPFISLGIEMRIMELIDDEVELSLIPRRVDLMGELMLMRFLVALEMF